MEDSKAAPQESTAQDPAQKPNPTLVLRSVDSAASSRTKYYDVDLESQQDIGTKKAEEKVVEKKSSKSSKKLDKGSSSLKNPKKVQRRTCNVCWLYAAYLAIVVAIALIIVVVKLVPKNPELSFGNVEVRAFTYNSTSERINMSLSFDLNITNRNFHAGEIYHDINLAVFYKDDSLYTVLLPGFRQRRKSTTALLGGFPGTLATIQNKPTADSLTIDMAKSNVQFELRGQVTGNHKILGIKVKSFTIPVRCKYNVNPGIAPMASTYSCYYNV